MSQAEVDQEQKANIVVSGISWVQTGSRDALCVKTQEKPKGKNKKGIITG